MDSFTERLSRNLLLFELRSVSGATGADSVPSRRRREAGVCAHPKWIRAGSWPHLDRYPGKLSAGRRLCRHPRSAAAVYERNGENCPELTARLQFDATGQLDRGALALNVQATYIPRLNPGFWVELSSCANSFSSLS